MGVRNDFGSWDGCCLMRSNFWFWLNEEEEGGRQIMKGFYRWENGRKGGNSVSGGCANHASLSQIQFRNIYAIHAVQNEQLVF